MIHCVNPVAEQNQDITHLLREMRSGNSEAERALYNLVYPELKRVAGRQMRRERAGHPLQTTALVHEAYMKLMLQSDVEWRDRLHFFSAASNWMRRILIDIARSRMSQKRAGEPVDSIPEELFVSPSRPEHFLALHEALERFEQFDPRAAKVVVMSFFGGMSQEEIAGELGLSSRTVKRDWDMARAWLRGALGGGGGARA